MPSDAIHQGLPARRQIKALKEAGSGTNVTHTAGGGPDVCLLLMVKKTTQEISITDLPHVSCYVVA